MNCIKCGKEHKDYHFRVLQVQTLHVRDFGKNSKIQALGDFEEYDVCAACAQEKYDSTVQVSAAVKKLCALWGAAFVTVCDLIARLAFRPRELPVGILLSALGGPFFLYILSKRGGRSDG